MGHGCCSEWNTDCFIAASFRNHSSFRDYSSHCSRVFLYWNYRLRFLSFVEEAKTAHLERFELDLQIELDSSWRCALHLQSDVLSSLIQSTFVNLLIWNKVNAYSNHWRPFGHLWGYCSIIVFLVFDLVHYFSSWARFILDTDLQNCFGSEDSNYQRH